MKCPTCNKDMVLGKIANSRGDTSFRKPQFVMGAKIAN